MIKDLTKEQEEGYRKAVNRLHGFVCDLEEQSKNLAGSDVVALVQFQLERMWGKKLARVKNTKK